VVSLDQLNQLAENEFVSGLGAIFEHSPWVAAAVANQRPFSSLNELHAAMVNAVQNANLETQLTLIRAHPDLGAKLKMSQQSVSEQAGLGLDRLSPEEFLPRTIWFSVYCCGSQPHSRNNLGAICCTAREFC
jgi:2-oxo-4-hydroxy-4-carboxy-5-ureidoimidazoline decarboxylase